jgi:hypothetical protein
MANRTFFEAETLEALEHFWIPMAQIFPWDFAWYSIGKLFSKKKIAR